MAAIVEFEGRRARKRREIHQRIATAALDLFFRDGFEATTVDAIADAADISRRNFFHYFSSKEDVVFFWRDEFSEALVETEPTAHEQPISLVEAVLLKVAQRHQGERIIAIDRLIRSTPALMARKQLHYDTQERGLASAMAQRWPLLETNGLRLIAIIGIGVLRTAVDAWSARGYVQPFSRYLNDGFALLRRELGGSWTSESVVDRKSPRVPSGRNRPVKSTSERARLKPSRR